MVLAEEKASGGIIQVEVCSRVSSRLTWPLSEPAHSSSHPQAMTCFCLKRCCAMTH